MISNAEHKHSEDYVRHIILPLTKLLDAPADLSEFPRVLEEFRFILELYRHLSDKSEDDAISRIGQLTDRVLSGDIPVITCIPSARARRERISMKPHCETHPHYCVYFHRCNYPDLQPQYRALLATFLPVQTRLQTARSHSPKPFSEVSYLVGLHLRQLSDPTPNEAQIIRQLPTEPLAPGQLRERIEALFQRYGYDFKMTGDLKSFGYLHRVLVWFDTGVWDQRFATFRKSTRGHQLPRHGGGLLSKVREIHCPTSHPQECGSPLKTQTFYTDAGESLGVSGQDADVDPLRDSGRVCESVEIPTQNASAFNAIDRIALSRRKARYASQAIEMGNQKLPITHAPLTGFELKVLIDALTDINHAEWSDVPQVLRPQIAAWGACRFFLGRGPNSLTQMRIHSNENSPDLKVAIWYPENATIWLPCELPLHKPPEDRSRVLTPRTGFTLDVTNSLALHLNTISSKNQKLFTRNFEVEFNELLSRLNHVNGTTLTLNRVGHFIPGLIAQLSPCEDVMPIYFSGRKPNQHNPSVYSAVPTKRLELLFSRACERVYELAQIHRGVAATLTFPTLISEDEHFVGSLHVPRIDTVRMTITDTRDILEKNRSAAGTPVHVLHNAYTAYVLLFLMATTGIRAVLNPIPAEFDIDRATGSCFISEKDTDGYRNARVVWLHPILVEQLDEYARHVTRLRQHLSLVNINALDKLDARHSIPFLSSVNAPNRTSDLYKLQGATPPLFMLSEYGGHPISIEPKKIEDILGPHWQLRLVSLRHFIRTQLLLSGCSGVLIDALLGHAERGESPWGIFSTLPPIAWRKQIAEHLTPILSRLNFEVVGSPLLRP